MRETIKLYYELRKIWIWTLLAIITIIAISSMVFNIGSWYQAKHTFDSHFDAHHYYEIRDYAQTLLSKNKRKQAAKVTNILSDTQGFHFVTNSKVRYVSKNAELAFYILTISPDSAYRNVSYKEVVRSLPETFSEYRHRVLRYYVSANGSNGKDVVQYSDDSPDFVVSGLPTSKQIYLPDTPRFSKDSGPFNKEGFYTHTFIFKQPMGAGPVVLSILIGAIFFLLDQIHWINPYMLQRSKDGRYLALAKSLCWFVIPGLLSCFYALVEFVLKGFLVPSAFANSDYGAMFSGLLVVLTLGLSLAGFGLLIDSFIGTIFGKIYTAIVSMFALALFISTAHMLGSGLSRQWHLNMKPFLNFVDDAFSANGNGFSWVELLIALLMLALAFFWYKKYSYDTDSSYVRMPKLKKPFFCFVVLLAVWDFILPLPLAAWTPSNAYFQSGQISSIVWWLAWGIGITLFTAWLIFKKPFKFRFLSKKNGKQ